MQLSINFSRSHHPISRLALMKRWSRNFSTNRRERKRGKEKEMAVMMQKKKKKRVPRGSIVVSDRQTIGEKSIDSSYNVVRFGIRDRSNLNAYIIRSGDLIRIVTSRIKDSNFVRQFILFDEGSKLLPLSRIG